MSERILSVKVEKDTNQQKINYGTILFSQADKSDKILMALGFTMAILNGVGLPSFVFIFGDVVNSFSE